MSDHYFNSSPHAARRSLTFETRVRGIEFVFYTDSGMFSKTGLDFGTRLLLENVELQETAHVVDLGCGYGPVATVLSTVYPLTKWMMIDVNERALELAARNVMAAQDRVMLVKSDGFLDVSYELYTDIVLNPPIRAGKATVYRLFEEARDHLLPSGTLWIVINKKHGADSAERHLRSLFLSVDRVARDAGYRIYRCRQPLTRETQ